MPRRAVAFVASLLFLLGSAGCGPDAAVSPPSAVSAPPDVPSERYISLMNAGRNHLEQGEATNALAVYRQAEAMVPGDPDVHLNLANASLQAGDAEGAIREAGEVIRLDPNSAAARFVRGSALLRLGRAEEAVKDLEGVRHLDPGEAATRFQLGRARLDRREWTEAIAAFREGLALDPNRLHAPVHYLLGQALARAGRTEEARQELEQHQSLRDAESGTPDLATLERSKYTQPRVPFLLDQPDSDGLPISLIDATDEVFGPLATRLSGPVAVVEGAGTRGNGLFALETGAGFRWLGNSNGVLQPLGPPRPAVAGAHYGTMLAGDLDNDRLQEVVVLGDLGSQVFRLTPDGDVAEVTDASQLGALRSGNGLLLDLDFTGKLDLVAVGAEGGALRIFRQSSPLRFAEIPPTGAVPAGLRVAGDLWMEDWNRDGTGDLIVGREGRTPLLLEKRRGGPLVPRENTNWVAGTGFCVADFDNNLRPDLAVPTGRRLVVCLDGGARREIEMAPGRAVHRLAALDLDNDGWLDLLGLGEGIRVWRNEGLRGFREISATVGLDRFGVGGAVEAVHAADFDGDCDPDLVVVMADGRLRYLRNDGGNANGMVKIRLSGNRSNRSGIGCKVEIASGGLRLIRTVHRLPVEIGVGRHTSLDSFLVHWFNWPQGLVGAPVDCRDPILAAEAILQEGSCPYLYAWDGSRFRFVTDILGAAPLGLPVAEGRLIDADPEEWVRIGDDGNFRPRDGRFQLAITEELREVLYLDHARLVVVDHAPEVEVHPTDKLLPGPPFPPGELMTLHGERELRRAERDDGTDVTEPLRREDGRRVSPPALRVPQLRGLAEPHGLTLDFGPLEPDEPWVLVLNGWLRFGGGMANIAAAQDPLLPFPFPTLEAEVADGGWRPVEVVVGAPAGKTKTILVDLSGKIPRGTRRLRLRQAFEIHWDRIALMRRQSDPRTRVTLVPAVAASLGWHGFGRLLDLPPDWPPTPSYAETTPGSPWTIIPEGWCTRHGDVLELVTARDEGLVLVNSGDELRLEFDAAALPTKPEGAVREYFLHADGWDKDSDFHVVTGTQVGPLPHHGMNSQRYGREERPPFASDELHRRYQTRWVEGRALQRMALGRSP